MSKFSIVKKITRQNIRTRLLIALVIFLIGVVLAIIQIPKTTRYFLANKNVFATSSDNYKKGKFRESSTISTIASEPMMMADSISRRRKMMPERTAF